MSAKTILAEKGYQVISIEGDSSLIAAAQLMDKHGIGALIISEGKKEIAGILSERDIMRAVAQKGAVALEQPVHNYMTKKVKTCSPDQTIMEIMELMTNTRIRHLPVVEDGKLCGIIAIGDVVKKRIAEAEMEAEALKGYITN
ncbi:MAG: CBS domain-containing protein [Parvibaculales bacterium]